MKRFLLVSSDIFILYLSLFVTLYLRYGREQRFVEQLNFHWLPFSILFLFWLFVFYIGNLYELPFLKNGWDFYGAFFKTIATSAMLGLIFFYLVPAWGIAPRRNFFLFLAIFAVLDFLARVALNKLIASRKFKRPTLIIGSSEQSRQLAHFLNRHPQLGYQLESILDTTNHNSLEILRQQVQSKGINTIIISPEAYRIPRLIETLYQFLPYKINFYPLSNFYEKVSSKVLLANIDQLWFLENLSEGAKKFYEIGKRAMDLVFGIIFGVIALALTPFIALAIKLSSPGPTFFRQTRQGQLGKPFQIIKFRTMIKDAEKNSGAVWAQENDPRITKVGRFLRRSRLDELPQLWNIVKGEMSFVGPRAERPEFHEQLKNEVPFYEERYLIKPGLTGWAQTRYRYGASAEDAAEKLQYDLFYIKHRSLSLDLSIILKTANIVLRQAGR